MKKVMAILILASVSLTALLANGISEDAMGYSATLTQTTAETSADVTTNTDDGAMTYRSSRNLNGRQSQSMNSNSANKMRVNSSSKNQSSDRNRDGSGAMNSNQTAMSSAQAGGKFSSTASNRGVVNRPNQYMNDKIETNEMRGHYSSSNQSSSAIMGSSYAMNSNSTGRQRPTDRVCTNPEGEQFNGENRENQNMNGKKEANDMRGQYAPSNQSPSAIMGSSYAMNSNSTGRQRPTDRVCTNPDGEQFNGESREDQTHQRRQSVKNGENYVGRYSIYLTSVSQTETL